MARTEVIEAHSKGEAVPKHRELADEDTLDHQMEVLTPSHTEFETVDGKAYYLPNEFTLRDIYRNKVMNALMGFLSTFYFEIEKMGVDTSDGISNHATAAAMLKESVQDALAEMLHIVLQKPKALFNGSLDANNMALVWKWTTATISKTSGQGDVKTEKKSKAR